MPLVLEELQECITLKDSTESAVDEILLKDSLNRFLETLALDERWILVHRCWYAESMREIADRLGISENNAKVILHRTRKN